MSDSSTGQISPVRHPKVRTMLVLSRPVHQWLIERARDDAEAEGGRPSMSTVLERLVRDAASRR